MQYIVFSIQAGLDNVELANLLDHASNVFPADLQRRWRKGNSLVAEMKTPSPPFWVNPNNLFYSNVPIYRAYGEYTINPIIVESVKSGRNVTFPINLTHFWGHLDNFSFAETLKTDVCAIYVYSNNKTRLATEIGYNLAGDDLANATNNINNIDPLDQDLWASLYPPGFNAVIEMDRIWTDWDYLNNILTGIGINLPKSAYDRYLTVFNRG